MLRDYFPRHRPLLNHLCTAAHHTTSRYLRSALGKSKAHLALILNLHIFGKYLHPYSQAQRLTGVEKVLIFHKPVA